MYLADVDPQNFVDSEFGGPGSVRGPANYAFTAYFPKSLPRTLSLDPETTVALSDADRAIGRLAGSGRLLKNPLLLADLYVRREALASTRIEGTQATLDDVLEAETGGTVGADVQEVLNYVNALHAGIEAINTGSALDLDLINALHRIVLTGVRGEDKRPGEIRQRPNWIGSNDPATARFVPPPHTELPAGLADWVAFGAEDVVMPPLIRCALLHYQFETLHPYLDGNGRLGRLLIVLFLMKNGHLPAPLLYVSTYFEHNKEEYYDTLQGVRERGDVQAWLKYFLNAVAVQANDAVRRSERLLDLGDDYRGRLAGSRTRAHELVDSLLASPWITTQHVRVLLGVTSTGATNLLRQLETAGILQPAPRVPGRSSRWIAHEVMTAIREDGV